MKFHMQRIFITTTALSLIYFVLLYAHTYRVLQVSPQGEAAEFRHIREIYFEGFNNETRTNEFIVPNIIHFIRFRRTNFSFVDAVCVLAAFKNQHPDKIMFHADDVNFVGPYWDKIKSTPGLVYEIVKITIPDLAVGQKFNQAWHMRHAADVMRIGILMKYGGIYLDNDVYIIQSVDKFRRFEMTIGWDENEAIGNQVLIAHKDARFLRLWLESYVDKRHQNVGFIATKQILIKKPELVHRVKWLFGIHITFAEKLYKMYWEEWSTLYSIHLLTNHRYYLDREHYYQYPVFTEKNIKNYTFTFGTMARKVYGIPE